MMSAPPSERQHTSIRWPCIAVPLATYNKQLEDEAVCGRDTLDATTRRRDDI